nr:MAG TPA: hypothetical protein [Caudoviricetes sp.]
MSLLCILVGKIWVTKFFTYCLLVQISKFHFV